MAALTMAALTYGRCDACKIIFFEAAALASHLCFAAMAGLDDDEEGDGGAGGEGGAGGDGGEAAKGGRVAAACVGSATTEAEQAEVRAAPLPAGAAACVSASAAAPRAGGALGLLCAYSDSEDDDEE
jgi:hypothetical protein